MDDTTMIAAALNGCQDAYAWLYTKHLPYVKATARAILRTNEIEDIAQDTFLLAFTRLASFEGGASFRTWITRIAMNQCLMILRRSRQAKNGEAHVVELEGVTGQDGESSAFEERVLAAEDIGLRSVAARLDLPKVMSALKPQQRELLRLAYLEELSEREIAERMSMTIPAVKSKIHHAKRRLREVRNKK